MPILQLISTSDVCAVCRWVLSTLRRHFQPSNIHLQYVQHNNRCPSPLYKDEASIAIATAIAIAIAIAIVFVATKRKTDIHVAITARELVVTRNAYCNEYGGGTSKKLAHKTHRARREARKMENKKLKNDRNVKEWKGNKTIRSGQIDWEGNTITVHTTRNRYAIVPLVWQ